MFNIEKKNTVETVILNAIVGSIFCRVVGFSW